MRLGQTTLYIALLIPLLLVLAPHLFQRFLSAADPTKNIFLSKRLNHLDYSGDYRAIAYLRSIFKHKLGQRPFRSWMMPSAERKSYFQVLQKFHPDYSPNVFTLYESGRTGMRVVVIDQKGPKVYGYFLLATEIHDDSGAPHTLEHLCFMGSKSYPYKGFLDQLASRGYADGTNAWTAVDHTAYTIEPAGWEGFANVLPVYLEHVSVPTLTDSACATEVHHVDGSGNDAGVVYSEMQGVQNQANELISLRANRIMYPEGIGYRYETGGMMDMLRVLTPDRIREFHRDMYQPKNLCLVITGEVDHGNMLEILDKFETSILDDIPSPDKPFKRPWTESKQVKPLTESVIEKVEFPEEDESSGQIEIRLLGPDCADPLMSAAIKVAWLYLAGGSAALLDNTLVEKEQICSAVTYELDARTRTEMLVSLSSVETGRLEEVEKRFFEVLKDAMKKELDMPYLQECIKREVRSWKYSTESSASSFATYVINDFLYGKRDGSTLRDIASLKQYDELTKWTESDWKDLIVKWISDAPHVSILGVPSAKLSQKLKSDEKARVEEQKKRLGEDGLKKKQEELEKAMKDNEKEIPKEALGKFKVPGTDSIHFVQTTTGKSGSALKSGHPNNAIQKKIESDTTGLPLFIHFEHIPTNFVRIYLLISTETVPLELRPLLSIYTEALFSLPIERDGKTIEFEKLVVELERDTVNYSIRSGEIVRITFEVELEKYDLAIASMKEIMWKSIYDPERLMAIVTRLIADIPGSKRSGSRMLNAIANMILFSPEHIGRAGNTLVRSVYLKRIKHMLKTDPESVVSRLKDLTKHLYRFDNFRVLVIADLERLSQPVSNWKPFIEGLDTSKPLQPVSRHLQRRSESGKNPGKANYIVPMPTVDSSFAYSTAKGPESYNDPKLPALMVALAYLNTMEGPLWVAVRGTGLAYGTNIWHDVDTGHIYLSIYRSPDAYKAFEASRKVVEGFVNGTTEIDPLMLEGAICNLVLEFVDEQPTLTSAAWASFARQVIRELPDDYMEKTLKQVRAVGVDEIKAALKDYVMNLFMPGKANYVVTCAPALEEPIKKGMESVGFKPEVKSLDYFQDDYGLKPAEGEEEELDDEDEEEEDGEDEEGDE